MASQLRICDNGIVRPIELSEDKLNKLNEILDSKKHAPFYKDNAIKAITGRCCVCGLRAEFQVNYPIDGATRIERYCSKCIEKVYAREQVL